MLKIGDALGSQLSLSVLSARSSQDPLAVGTSGLSIFLVFFSVFFFCCLFLFYPTAN